jgi:hypothetical protein
MSNNQLLVDDVLKTLTLYHERLRKSTPSNSIFTKEFFFHTIVVKPSSKWWCCAHPNGGVGNLFQQLLELF